MSENSGTPEVDINTVRGFEALRITKDEDEWVRADLARSLESRLSQAHEESAYLRGLVKTREGEISRLAAENAELKHCIETLNVELWEARNNG